MAKAAPPRARAPSTGENADATMRDALKHTIHIGREYLTHWIAAGVILALTGAAPEHWLADLFQGINVSPEALHLWAANIDLRIVLSGLGFAFIVGDLIWMRSRGHHSADVAVATPAPAAATLQILPLPDKPSIAVLPFANLSGDPAQEYFSDGITEDIITELSRFHALFVIARNSTFTYKNKPADVRQVARELGVRYVLEGSARKVGDRARVSAQLVDAISGNHLWAEHFDRTLDDVFAMQEDVTRGIVAAVAPEVELAEMEQARHASPNDNALRLTWRAQGLMLEGVRTGRAALVLDAIATARQAAAADPTSLAAYNVLAWANFSVHLYRWGPEPAKALDEIAAAVEQMARLNALDHRTLTISGVLRVVRGEHDRGLADLRRALEVNPNSSQSLMWLALCEAMAGLGEAAKAHATLSLRLNPRDFWIGVAHVALAMVSFCARDYADAARLAELAIQSEPAVPLRRAIMIACCAQLGDQARAAKELAVLKGFAPDFMASLFRGDFQVFRRPDDMQHLRDSLRLAGVMEQPA
jgi:TolB-like protein